MSAPFLNSLPSKTGLALLVFFILWITLNLHWYSPPKVIPASAGDQQFSAERAFGFVEAIASEPHPSGTPPHARVRDYILAFCRDQGFETQLQEHTGLNIRGHRGRAGWTQNILARLPGSASSKTIVVMSHYDSEPNTPGATDDGAGVAAMMEVMRIIRKGTPLKNDVLFLFTDQEETGLLGAEAFVAFYEDLASIGLLLNFEARGNAGPAITFEVTKNNSWLMREYRKAVSYAFASSLAYEVYKILPNDTDFSAFRNTGIEGYNTAFIDGFSYYHSMADRPENMDLRSLQHLGNILLASLNHFGNLALDEKHPAEDAIFFNPAGSWLWIYHIHWDVPLIVLCVLLFMTATFAALKKERIGILKMLVGIGLFLGFIVTSMVLVWLMQNVVLFLYPHYTNFDNQNPYHAYYYLFTIIGLVLICFVVWYAKVVAKPLYESYFMGAVFVLVVLMIALKITLPTAAYLLYYPLSVALALYLLLTVLQLTPEKNPVLYAMFLAGSSLPALSLWVPIIYLVFVTFSLGVSNAPALFASFTLALIIPSLHIIRHFNRWAIVSIALVLILTGFILAHVNSTYTKHKPLQTYLTYLVDADAKKALWVSAQNVPDAWMEHYISAKAKEDLEWFDGIPWKVWRNEAPLTLDSADVGRVKILTDTVLDQSRTFRLLITGGRSTNSMDLMFSPDASVIQVNERALPQGVKRLSFWAVPNDGFEITVQTPADSPVKITLFERKIGLPNALLNKPLPENMIHGPGAFHNTTQMKRKIVL